jgi:quinol monooxygenase YgiN
MIERIILARPRAEITDDQRDALVAAAHKAFETIPGVLSFTFGISEDPDESNAWHLRIRFQDEAALHAFDAHPAHVNFMIQRWRPAMMGYSVRDYQVRLDATFPPQATSKM